MQQTKKGKKTTKEVGEKKTNIGHLMRYVNPAWHTLGIFC